MLSCKNILKLTSKEETDKLNSNKWMFDPLNCEKNMDVTPGSAGVI